jgi:hypothetical protein
MVKNQVIGHSEDPSLDFYTTAGDTAARNSNLMHAGYDTTARHAVESWMTGPFHALGILDPRLKQVGYGTFRERGHDASFEFAAALDVLRGFGDSSGTTYPVKYPGPGTTTFLSKYTGNEAPDPLTSCPQDYSAPTGAPIMLELKSFAPLVTSSLTDDKGNTLAHCTFDSATYVNPSASIQNDARSVLAARSAIVMIPKAPLKSGSTYNVSITAGLTTTAWSFKVGDTAAPSTRITTPAHGMSYDQDQFRKLQGTSVGGARKVQISLAKYMNDQTCRFWTGTKFVTRSCTSRVWLNAQGTSSWSYSLSSKLQSSTGNSSIANYLLWTRGKDASGNVESAFKLQRNYVGFNITP